MPPGNSDMTPAWLQLLRDALDLEFAHRPRIATLATVDATHRPRARSIVVRGIDDNGALHITSDARSDKNTHLRATPFAELVFWLPTRREQFRLAGPTTITTLADNHSLLESIWRSIPDATRATFTWPAPGKPWPSCDNAFTAALDPSAPIPESFELITLHPDQVDRLDLTPTPHRRTRWQQQTAWQPEDLNP
jgi:PPOX class probable FMN-dependent enzyme